MDEEVLNELLECSVCLDRLDLSSKVLPCQHTFCKRCLEEIIGTKKELRCPECRALVEIPIDELPSNILLIRLLEGIKQNARPGGSTSSSPVNVVSSPTSGKVGNITSSFSVGNGKALPHKAITSRACAKALYSYEGTDPGDLAFKKNDVILLLKQVDNNWYHGELSGQVGFFPASYVQVITPLNDGSAMCKALYNFQVDKKNENSDKGCLNFNKDDVLSVIRRVDENWAEGKIGDKIGIFPIAFVEMNEPAKELMQKSLNIMLNENRSSGSQQQSTTDPGGGSDSSRKSSPTQVAHKRHSLTIPTSSPVAVQPHRYSAELISSVAVPAPAIATVMTSSPHVSVTSATTVPKAISQNSLIPNMPPALSSRSGLTPTTPTTPSGHTLGPPPSTPPPPPPPLFIALYGYKPQKEDELQLQKGDFYTVTEKCQDGWFKGSCLKSGKVGVFPGNYVQLVRHRPNLVPTPVTPTSHGQSTSTSSQPGQSHSTWTGSSNTPATMASTSTTTVLTRPAVSPSQSGFNASLDYQVNTTRVPPVVPRHSASRQAGTPTSTGSLNQPPPLVPRTSSSQMHGAVGSPGPATSASRNSSAEKNKRRNSAPLERISPRPAAPLPLGVSENTRQSSPRQSASNLDNVPPVRTIYNRPLPATPTSDTPHSSLQHSPSTSTSVTPPNAGGAGAAASSTGKEKKEKKDKEKSAGFMKRFTSKGKVAKPKVPILAPLPTKSFHGTPGNESNFAHAKSTSVGEEDTVIVQVPMAHRKSGPPDTGSAPPQLPKKPKPLPKERYRVIVPYPPQTPAELELKVGDLIYVHKKREDGWFKGTLARTGIVGLFPGSFAVPID